MKIIKNHPIAFTLLIGWEIFSIAGIISIKGDGDNIWAGISGLLVLAGAIVFLAGIIAWIISAIRRRNKSTDNAKRQTDDLAKHYMINVRAKSISWVFALILLPIIPVLLVHVLDYYMAGVFFMTLGIMAWTVRFSQELIINRFYTVKNADKYFTIESGENSELLDSFYGDYVHVYRAESFSQYQLFIASLLKWENILGKEIKCYRVPIEFLSKKYDCDYNPALGELILIPFSQFDFNPDNRKTLRNYLDRLSMLRYTELVNLKYKEKTSLEPSQYVYTSESAKLRPFAATIKNLAEKDGDMLIALDGACEDGNIWKKYYNCLAVIKGVEKLSDENIQWQGNYISGCKLSDGNILEMTLTAEYSEDYEYEEDYCEETTFRCRYEKIEWYWDGFCDCEKTRRIFE